MLSLSSEDHRHHQSEGGMGIDSSVLSCCRFHQRNLKSPFGPSWWLSIMTGILRLTQYTHISREMLRHNDLRISSFSCFSTELKKKPQLTLHSLFHATHDLPLIYRNLFSFRFQNFFFCRAEKMRHVKMQMRWIALLIEYGVEFMHSPGLLQTCEPSK